MMRGVNRQIIFEEDSDYRRFLNVLKKCKEISGCKIYAYCLMPNHVHLLVSPEGEDLDVFMKRICCRYVYWFNKKYGRIGHLFQDRFKSENIENEAYFLTVLRYIIQNPVKACICSDVESYRWSCYNDYYFRKNSITDTGLAVELSGGLKRLIKFVNEANEDQVIDYSDKKFVLEKKAKETMVSVTGCKNLSDYQRLSPKEQKDYVRRLYDYRLSMSQIAKLTGKSKTTVYRILSN